MILDLSRQNWLEMEEGSLSLISMLEPFFVLEGVGPLDSRDTIRRHGAEGSSNTERVWVVLAGSSSILSKGQIDKMYLFPT